MTQTKPNLILASASPRRKALLESMGLEFSVRVTDIDESPRNSELPRDYVSRLAEEKAHSARNGLDPQEQSGYAILAADTIVCQGANMFAKPDNQEDAFRIWRTLSNSNHQVITAICLLAYASVESRLSITDVKFGPISETQMYHYWQSGEPRDKAGAYAIQGLASAWVEHISGSYSNVVGLPLYDVNQLLAAIDLNWM